MSSLSAAAARAAVVRAANPTRAAAMNTFMRNVPGGYGHPDAYLGVPAPPLKALAVRIARAEYDDDKAKTRIVESLVRDAAHEVRLVGWMVLRESSQRAYRAFSRATDRDDVEAAACARLELDAACASALRMRGCMRNWDEVDTTMGVVGLATAAEPSARKRLAALRALADAGDAAVAAGGTAGEGLWTQRLSVVATQSLIRQRGSTAEILHLARRYLKHDHDLMHKAVGWMLRELGDADAAALERFFTRHGAVMPRTMLRYAIEKLSVAKRERFMQMRARAAPV
jgi:3-methyladenine DNA glycosylase AlkD